MAAASGPVDSIEGKSTDIDEMEQQDEHDFTEIQEQNVQSEDISNEFRVPKFCTEAKNREQSSGKASKKSSSFTFTNSTSISNTITSITNSSDTSEDIAVSQIKKKIPFLSPAEQLKQTHACIPYKEPTWSGIPPESKKYSFDVLKNGTVAESIELCEKPWIVFGRLPSCDVFLEHPSLSRYHAVVQYRDTSEDGHECGWYLYDLDSTHGTWVNKVKVKPKVYRRLRVGHVIKFGGSTRLYILQGPEDDREPECELSVKELKEQTERLKKEAELLKQADIDQEEARERERQKILEARGCSWGIGEDAEEEANEKPFIPGVPEHEHMYKDDPKKALKGFYEREGCDLPDYQFTEVGFGKHKCAVELPVDGPYGEPLVAEATVSGKKKDAVIACAFEACRLLDIHGLLHASKHEGHQRKKRNWEDDDYYDSDEDTFLDRTGTIEKKRIYRMQKAGKEMKAETYDSLVPQHEKVQMRITEIEHQLEQAKKQMEAAASEEDDALEAYMTAIKAGVMDTKTRLSLKRELLTLRTEEQRLRRLVNLAKPADMPELKKLDREVKKATTLSALGTRVRKIATVKGPKKSLTLPTETVQQSDDTAFQEEEEEEEEEEVEEENKQKDTQSQQTKTDINGQSLTSQERSRSADKPLEKMARVDNDRAEKSSHARLKVTGKIKIVQQASPLSVQGSQVNDLQNTKEVQNKTKIAGESQATAVIGPAMPPPAQSDSKRTDKKGAEIVPSSEVTPKSASPHPTNKKLKTHGSQKADYDASDPDYAIWLPPQGQTGDGRTSLNDKLGY